MYLRYIFVGRIDYEKGVQHILDAADRLIDIGIDTFQIDFFGSGHLVEAIRTHRLFETHLYYHGRKPKEDIFPVRKQAHITLVPSLFLETFGLTALDSLAVGVPVIGSKKGGLVPFIIEPSLDSSDSLFGCMHQVCTTHTPEQHLLRQQKALHIASHYTTTQRLDRLGQLSKNCKKYLFVSDYAKDIGGIENFLFAAQAVLRKDDIDGDVFGKTWGISPVSRKRDLVVAVIGNIRAAGKLKKQLAQKSYDVLWLHSISRRIGRSGLLVVKWFFGGTVWMMYHDVGLIHPFPSKVYTTDQLDRSSTFSGYLQEGERICGARKRFFGGRLLVLGKYIYSHVLFLLLDNIVTHHVVPSAYLIPYVKKHISKAPVDVFSHFVIHAQDLS